MSTPPPKSHWTTMKPLHGQQLTIALRPTTCPVCLPVCCHWLPPFKAFSQSQGYDLCHVSFLRLFSAIPLTASCISGFRVSVVVAFCGFMVGYLSFPIGHASLATMQGLHGAPMRCGWGVDTEYHHLVVQGCILGRWLCLCASFVVVFLGHLFLVLSG